MLTFKDKWANIVISDPLDTIKFEIFCIQDPEKKDQIGKYDFRIITDSPFCNLIYMGFLNTYEVIGSLEKETDNKIFALKMYKQVSI